MLYLLNNAVFDQLDLVTYEEVVKQENFRRKTLVLLGMFSLSFHTLVHVLSYTANSIKVTRPKV